MSTEAEKCELCGENFHTRKSPFCKACQDALPDVEDGPTVTGEFVRREFFKNDQRSLKSMTVFKSPRDRTILTHEEWDEAGNLIKKYERV